nr:MAG: ORF1 [TTV-like mini virus]
MPFYRRRYYFQNRWNKYRNRRRRFWRRTRKALPRRHRRRRRVRRKRFFKKKLKKLKLYQYQPKSIRRCKVRGLCCLFQCNFQKVYFNFQMYESSIVPNHLPGGGGFCIKSFSLDALYEEYQHCRNYWTHGNSDYPLVRYLGCKFKLYQSHSVDYVFSYNNTYPMIATMESYNATQPSMHMMNKRNRKVPSKITQPNRKKPYITVRIRPPSQLQNKWYLMHDLSHIPLVMIQCSACSFDNYFISSKWDSTCINITTLKAGFFTNTNFAKPEASGYYCTTTGTQKVYLYATLAEEDRIQVKDLIFLGNSYTYTPGYAGSDRNAPAPSSNWTDFKQNNKKNWGNPFHPDMLSGHYNLYSSTTHFSTYINNADSNPNNPVQNLTKVESFIETLRYAPNRDTGDSNFCYFKPVTKDEYHWDIPQDQTDVNRGYPCWLLLWGYSDFVKRIGKKIHLETEHCLVLKTNTTFPIRNPIIPLSQTFVEGHSPFEDSFNPLDRNRWYPCLQMQYEAVNDICMCGPGTPKLNGRRTVEAKCLYTFYFKFGGSPPTMSVIDDPAEQPTYPVPNNLQSRPEVQSPGAPIQTFLYHFDTKRDILTPRAIQRITKDFSTKKTVFADGDSRTAFAEQIYQEPQTTPTEEEKETQETILQLIQQQRQEQRLLKQQILHRLTLQSTK